MKKTPILFIDKKGDFVRALDSLLPGDYFWVVVSKEKASKSQEESLLHIPYRRERKKIPVIPQYPYEYVVLAYEGELEIKERIRDLIQEAALLRARFVLLIKKRSWDEELVQIIINSYKNAVVVVLGDCFDEAGEFDQESLVNRLIDSAALQKRIYLTVEGMTKVYPVYAPTAMRITLDLVFSKKDSGVFFVFPKNGMTELAFSRVLQKSDPLIGVDFSKQPIFYEDQAVRLKGTYVVLDSSEMIQKIPSVLYARSQNAQKRRPVDKKMASPNHIKKTSAIRTLLAGGLLSLGVFITLPTLIVFGGSYLGAKQLSAGGSYKTVEKSYLLFSVASRATKIFILQATLLGRGREALLLSERIDANRQTTGALIILQKAFNKLDKRMRGEEKGLDEDFFENLQKIKEQVLFFQKAKVQYKQELDRFDELDGILSSILDTFPYVFGFDSKKTYLVLFQNNERLWPTGGKIEAFSLMDIEKGAVTDFSIRSVVEADRALKGHVDPPLALMEYFGAKHWFLQDSNFDPEFVSSASTAAFFIKEETGKTVDGVVALDTQFLKELLGITDEETSFQRLIEKAVQSLSKKEKSLLDLFVLLSRASYKKHALFAFFDADVQKSFETSSLTGSLVMQKEKGENEFLDTVGISESNLGKDALSSLVERTISYQLTIDKEENWQSLLVVSYANNNKTAYKNYLRAIVPLGSELHSVEIDGVKMDRVDIEEKERVTTFGFFTEIAPLSSQSIKVSYTLPFVVSDVKSFFYNLYVVKQPGTQNDKFSIALSYPSVYKPIIPIEGFSQVPSKLSYTTRLATDKDLSLDFIRLQ